MNRRRNIIFCVLFLAQGIYYNIIIDDIEKAVADKLDRVAIEITEAIEHVRELNNHD